MKERESFVSSPEETGVTTKNRKGERWRKVLEELKENAELIAALVVGGGYLVLEVLGVVSPDDPVFKDMSRGTMVVTIMGFLIVQSCLRRIGEQRSIIGELRRMIEELEKRVAALEQEGIITGLLENPVKKFEQGLPFKGSEKLGEESNNTPNSGVAVPDEDEGWGE